MRARGERFEIGNNGDLVFIREPLGLFSVDGKKGLFDGHLRKMGYSLRGDGCGPSRCSWLVCVHTNFTDPGHDGEYTMKKVVLTQKMLVILVGTGAWLQ